MIIRLAGVPIQIKAAHKLLSEMCQEYICEEKPAFEVEATAADVNVERLISEEADRNARRNIQSFSDAYLETLAVYRQIAEKIVEFDVLLFHGSVVAVDGKAYLFTADSGTGKSTHVRLWRKVLPEHGHNVVMVNDDKPLLRFAEDTVFACGTPWDGKHHLSNNIEVPLRGICFLSRGEENKIQPVTGDMAELMKHCFRHTVPEHIGKEISLLDKLRCVVPTYQLFCNMEREAAIVSYEGMCNQ